MTKLTIELPDETARLAEEGARLARMSLGEWINLRIAGGRRPRSNEGLDDMGYPHGWFERTEGSLADVDDFEEPSDCPAKPVPSLEP